MKPDDTRHRRGLVAARVIGAFVALYLAFAPGPAATQELQVIELHYRLADAVIPTLQPLLEPGGVLTGMDNMLFVRTSPANCVVIGFIVLSMLMAIFSITELPF